MIEYIYLLFRTGSSSATFFPKFDKVFGDFH